MKQTWIRGPVIGRGATATVSLASSVSDPHRRFAFKSSDISRSFSLQNEHDILSKIGPHPNLITSFGFDVSEGHCNLLTEYVPGGTLADRIRNHENGRLNEAMIRFYTFNILMGLDFLHASGVVHCDIKSENVLTGDDGIVKIADLGFSKTEGLPTQSSAFSGTPAFMAPEVARGEAQGFAADIWALGCTIIEMATGKNPFPEETNPVSALYKIGFSGRGPTIPSTLSEKGRDFVGKCLIKNPTERWTARELLKHPFVTELNVTTNVEESSLVKKNRSSPTCVLDLAFWDQLDSTAADDDGQLEDCDHQEDDDCSAFERIARLDSGPPSTSSWEFDENWITVRTNCVHQLTQFASSCYNDRIGVIGQCQESGTSSSVQEEFRSSNVNAHGDEDCVMLLNVSCNQKHLCKQEWLSLIQTPVAGSDIQVG